MRVSSLSIYNFRSIANIDDLKLGPLNVFIGSNNCGKSSILKALHSVQADSGISALDIRFCDSQSSVNIDFVDNEERFFFPNQTVNNIKVRVNIDGSGTNVFAVNISANNVVAAVLSSKRGGNFIIPHLSKRKAVSFSENVAIDIADSVSSNYSNLSSKISRLSNFTNSGSSYYNHECDKLLGFVLGNINSTNGLKPGIYFNDEQSLPIEQMGEGVPNLVSMLSDLATAKGKLFLIEEPENDLHPNALKRLLDLIIEKSKYNQFVISTHSNIVLKKIGAAEGALVYNIHLDRDVDPPATMVSLVENSPKARISVLQDLGYDVGDFELWDGWLFLEEASAQTIIGHYLIPWFAPRLARLRLVSCGGTGGVSKRFNSFNELFLFAHLEEIYRHKAWVRIDGDDDGIDVISQLREKYKQVWAAETFGYWNERNFERYFPIRFKEKVDFALSRPTKEEKRAAKYELLMEVCSWVSDDLTQARDEFENSAADIISHLKMIEVQLLSKS